MSADGGKILMIDDDEDVLLAAKMLLKKQNHHVIIEKNPNKIPFLLNNDTYDVILLDMELPGKSGIEVARELKNEKLGVSILALSAHDSRHYIHGLLANGASHVT